MTGTAERQVREDGRTWRPDGFTRTITVIESVSHTLGCAVVLRDGPGGPVALTVARDADTLSLPVRPEDVAAFGALLFDGGCAALASPAAHGFFQDRTAFVAGAIAWLEIGPGDLGLRVGLVVATRPHTFLRLAPKEAVQLGLLLIRAGVEASESRAPAEVA